MAARPVRLSRAALAGLLSLLLLGAGFSGLVAAPAARADSVPADPTNPATPTTVTADALPTVQINGVAWAQVVVGNTVYVTGKFTSARPAGAPAGTNETTRNNLLAYDIRTGQLITSFTPNLNGQGLAIAASPDGSRIYVGGDFTTADGQSRSRIAAYSTATGQLVSTFKPVVGTTVQSIATSGTTVYLGGLFSSVGGVSRTRLAAVNAADGSLLSWAPVAGAGTTDGKPAKNFGVRGIVVTNSGAQVVVAGAFGYLNGAAYSGIGAVDAVTGANRPFQMGQIITNQGDRGAVYSLSTDGTTVFGTAYDYNGGGGNTEGSFAVTPDGGRPVWVNDCHGDSYSSFPSGGALYIASHSYDCASVGGFGYSTAGGGPYHFATAVTTAATSTARDTAWSALAGLPASTMVDWFPTFTGGTVTGQAQAGWTVSGNGSYVVYGGEFPKVNGTAQAGLVRFALPGAAPNKVGPVASTAMTPSVVSVTAGAARVSWQTTWDPDNENLTYLVRRSDRPTSPVHTTTAASRFYQLSTLYFVDTGLTPGRSYTYAITAVDPYGNQRASGTTTVTASAATVDSSAYAAAVAADAPSDVWRLAESAGATTAYDSAGLVDLTVNSGVTLGSAGLVAGSTDPAATFDGSPSGFLAAQTAVRGPQSFSIEATFATTSTAGGKILGLGDSATGNSGTNDRNLYLDPAGHVKFGVWDGYTAVASSTGTYNDGLPHHVVATFGSGVVSLYVDGALVGQRAGVGGAQDFWGYWRIGGDSSWEGARYFTGSIDDVAIYPTVLSAAQVARHAEAGLRWTPSAVSATPGTVRVSWPTFGDPAVEGLTYELFRSDQPTVAVHRTVVGPSAAGTVQTYVDRTLAAGTQVTYSVRVSTPGGVLVSSSGASTAVTGAAAGSTAYADTVTADGPTSYWRLDESGGRTGYDSAGSGDLTVGTGATQGVPGLLTGTADTAARFDGSSSGSASTTTAVTGPQTFSVEAWFATTSTSGGKLVGFGDRSSGSSGSNDRNLYMDAAGHLKFGVWLGWAAIVAGDRTYNDGAPHHVVASLGNGVESLYVDGVLVAQRDGVGGAQDFTGFWRVGGDRSWEDADYFTGTLDDVAVYPTALTADQVARHYVVGSTGRAPNAAPVAAMSATPSGLDVALDGSTSTDAEGPISSFGWDFGDGTSGSGATVSHTYGAAGTYQVVLTVVDGGGRSATSTQAVTVVAAPNQDPTADFSVVADDLDVSVDAASSADADGTVDAWVWDFGDGATAAGVSAQHTYAAAGSYVVSLTVTDDDGARGSASRSVVVSAPNRVPVASFTSTGSFLDVTVDGSASTDVDGSVRSYGWAFGDGSSATGMTAAHSFAAAGTYLVQLTVTDDRGATAVSTQSVTVAAAPVPNQVPSAAFTVSGADLALSFDGRSSTDADGTVVGYGWDFGDGSTATGATVTHRFAGAGTYAVTLTVTDDDGVTGSTTSSVVATLPANQAPTAVFTGTTNGLGVNLDGSGSTDPDGTLAGYGWDFGDGTTGSGRTVTHTYLAGGVFTVTLTVTDDRAGTASMSAQVTVAAPTVFAQDAFSRAIAAGWGTADTGGSYTVTGTTSVSSGAGQLTAAAGRTSTASLAVNRAEAAIQATVQVPQTPTGGGTYVSVGGQRVGGSEYRLKLWFRSSGAVQATLVRVVDNVETSLGSYLVPGSQTPGTTLTVRLDLSGAPTGTTTLRAKVWVIGTPEPTSWNVQATDSTASLQRAGGVGVTQYVSGSATASSTVRVDDLWVGPTGAAPGR